MEDTQKQLVWDLTKYIADLPADMGNESRLAAISTAIGATVTPLFDKITNRDELLAGAAATITTTGLKLVKIQGELDALCVAGRAVVLCWESGDLAAAVRELDSTLLGISQ